VTEISQKAFRDIVAEAIDSIPPRYASHINNVAFVVEDAPTDEQRHKLRLAPGHTLFGLYEGIPMTKRGNNYNLVLPDKITLFKQPIETASNSQQELKEIVQQTIWHEVAHYYGLDHDAIHALESDKIPPSG